MMQLRTIRLSYCPDAFTFDSDAKFDAFCMAVGRMCLYQTKTDHPAWSDQYVNLDIDKHLEITGAYYPKLPPRPVDATYTGSTEQIINSFLDWLRTHSLTIGRPFIMGAVPREEGARYTFHS